MIKNHDYNAWSQSMEGIRLAGWTLDPEHTGASTGNLCPKCSLDNLLALIKADYKLDWDGIHGVGHWQRVAANGRKLAELNGANRLVVRMFAYLHDSQRENNQKDRDHGLRAAKWVLTSLPDYYPLTMGEIGMLTRACEMHNENVLGDSITVSTCLDADRLDLARPGVGYTIDTRYLSTPQARDQGMIEWAIKRSKENLRDGE